MRTIFPCSYYLPETAASLYLTDNIIHSCAESNVEVDLYTPTPTRGVPDGAVWDRHEVHCNGKLHIYRFHMYGEGKNPILRAFRYILCEFYLTYKCLFAKYDVAFIDSTPPIQGLKNPLIKLFRRKHVVYNAQDIFPDSLVGTGLAKKDGVLWKIGRVIEKITYRYSDKIIVISEDFKRNIMAKGVPEEKIVVVYNWVDEEAVKPINKGDNPLFEELNINRDKFTIVYAGNLGHAQNVQILIDTANQLKEQEDIQFIIFGTGGLETQYKNYIQKNGITNITFHPLQPYEKVSQVYGIGDVCIVSCKEGLGGSAMPSKTWSIMSSGRAVLANFDEGDLKGILESNNCGIFTKAGDKEAFKQAILDLYRDKAQCEQLGRNGREFILKNLTRAVGTQKYVDVIKSFEKKI